MVGLDLWSSPTRASICVYNGSGAESGSWVNEGNANGIWVVCAAACVIVVCCPFCQ